MKKQLFILLALLTLKGLAQEISAQELLDKSIAYHDPDGKWANFKGSFTIKMETPKRPVRTTKIELDFPQRASFDLYDNYEDRGNQFKEAVRGL